MIRGLVDLAVGLVLGMGLFGDLDVGQLIADWLVCDIKDVSNIES